MLPDGPRAFGLERDHNVGRAADFGRPALRFVFPPRRLNLWAVDIGDYRGHSLFSKAVCSNILIGGANMKVQTLPLDPLQTL